ncbi:hypothetical protein G9A89_017970 [Geosiphon pyriformis]|nr:hypothetical protein G9A89_017970 [Geosiphon pyriformis]
MLSGLQSLPPQLDFGTPPQQPLQQIHQLPVLQQQQQMTYAPIVKLNKFTSEEDNAQDTTNAWYQSLTIQPQNFNKFKTEFLRYFNNNNSINKLANTFITIKQGETEAVTTYLEWFHKNLRQIQVIQADYFTAPQILNQFIRELHSNILQRIRPMHPQTLQDAVTNVRDFEVAELEANHAQAVNLVMNGSSELDSKLKQFSNSINQKLEGYLADNHTIYQPPQQHNNSRNTDCFQNQSCPTSLTNQQWQQEIHICHYCGRQEHLQFECRKKISDQKSVNHSISTKLPTYDAANISNTNDTAIILTSSLLASSNNLLTIVPIQLSATVSSKLSVPITSNTTTKLTLKQNSKTKINTAKLEIIDGSPSTDPSSTAQLSRSQPWNSGTRYAQNPNSQNYLSLLITPEDVPPNNPKTNQKQSLTNNIPLAIITNDELLVAIFSFEFEELSQTPLFSRATFEKKPITIMYTDAKVNGHFIKLILDSGSTDSIITKQFMDQLATKILIGEIDDFLIEVNGIIVPIKVLVMKATQYQALIAMCGHFTTTNSIAPLIEFEEKKEKPTWKAYQVSWADEEHNELLPKEENSIPIPIHSTYMYTIPQSSYCYPKLICVDCGKKLLSMSTCCGNNEEYSTVTKFYYRVYIIECFGHPKQKGKWDNESCLACGKTLLDKGMWNDIPE